MNISGGGARDGAPQSTLILSRVRKASELSDNDGVTHPSLMRKQKGRSEAKDCTKWPKARAEASGDHRSSRRVALSAPGGEAP
jgi:hypothetical protein